jgi:hypothetical protein
MINTTEGITNLLQGTFLEEKTIQTLSIDQSDEVAFAFEIDSTQSLEAWKLLRSLLDQTNRYPIIVNEQDLSICFSRFPYTNEQRFGKLSNTTPQVGKLNHTSPQNIIAAVSKVDLAAFFDQREAEYTKGYNLMEDLEEEFGDDPEVAQIQELIENQRIRSKVDLEAWLFKWEFENFQNAHQIRPPVSENNIWYDPNVPTLTILLLPTPNSWESLAYLHWWGGGRSGTTIAMALLKEWWQIYEAELVHHFTGQCFSSSLKNHL